MNDVLNDEWLDGFDGFIFDCDGTLVDSLEAHFKAWEQVFREYGIDLPISFLHAYNSIPSYVIAQDLIDKLNLSCTSQEIADRKESLLFESNFQAKELSPITAIAKKYSGKKPMAVVSGGIRVNVVKSLEDNNLLGLFELVVAADDTTNTKDRPEVWLDVAKTIGIDPQRTLVFEDGEKGMEGALLAGMKVFDVRLVLSEV